MFRAAGDESSTYSSIIIDEQFIASNNNQNKEVNLQMSGLTIDEQLDAMDAELDKDLFPFFSWDTHLQEIDLTNINESFFRCRALARETRKKYGLDREVNFSLVM